MNIQERIQQSEAQFDQYKAKKEELLRQADDCQVEMTKLQGEWRVLKELEADEAEKVSRKKVNKTKADTIEVVPEGEVA